MKHYEGMFLLHNREPSEEPSDQGEAAATVPPEDAVKAVIEKCGGSTTHTLVWANRKLAYPIAGNQSGTYVLTYFSGEPDLCTRLDREVALSERLLRYLALSIEELPEASAVPGPLTEPRALPTRRPREEAEEGAPAEKPGKSEKSDEDAEKGESATLDYKNIYYLRRMVTAQGKLYTRVRSGLDARRQRALRRAVLRARNLALLPFVAR